MNVWYRQKQQDLAKRDTNFCGFFHILSLVFPAVYRAVSSTPTMRIAVSTRLTLADVQVHSRKWVLDRLKTAVAAQFLSEAICRQLT